MRRFHRILVAVALCAAVSPAESQDMPGAEPAEPAMPMPSPPPPAPMAMAPMEPEETLCSPGAADTIKTLRQLTAQQKLYIQALEQRVNMSVGGH